MSDPSSPNYGRNFFRDFRSSGRTDLSRRRQQESYEQRVRNGDDAVRNNPEQR